MVYCIASEGRSETGQVVRDNVTAWFELNGDDGRLRVVRQLDREKAEIIRLVVRVEDTAAANSFQTASGISDLIFNHIFIEVSITVVSTINS